MYLSFHPSMERALDEAILAHDPAAIRHAAHVIHGNSVIFSAQSCMRIAQRIEFDSRHDVDFDWADEASRLKTEMSALVGYLRAFLRDGTG
jgi:HPt (histidine-containing phosphotransfer) domain-containing protein